MTVSARHISMLPIQFEAGKVVIEADCFPRISIVTAGAIIVREKCRRQLVAVNVLVATCASRAESFEMPFT